MERSLFCIHIVCRISTSAIRRLANLAGRRGFFAAGRYTLPNFAILTILNLMSTMNISLPENLKHFVDQQVAGRGYGTSSEYVRELIRRDRDRQRLRDLLLEGASSEATGPVDAEYFDSLRDRALRQNSK